MIWESHYWKDPLLASANYLRRVRLSDTTTEKTFVRIEKELFLGFYAIRKLLDTFEVSDSTRELRFSIRSHATTKRVDHLNWHRIDQNYDLTAASSETKDLRFLCNQFIHSFVFVTSESDKRLDGFFIASDRERHKKLYFVDLAHVLKAFRVVGKDYPAHMELRRDEHGQWVAKVGQT